MNGNLKTASGARYESPDRSVVFRSRSVFPDPFISRFQKCCRSTRRYAARVRGRTESHGAFEPLRISEEAVRSSTRSPGRRGSPLNTSCFTPASSQIVLKITHSIGRRPFLFLGLRGFNWVNCGECPFLTRRRRGPRSRRGLRYGAMCPTRDFVFPAKHVELVQQLLVVAELELRQKLRLMTRMTSTSEIQHGQQPSHGSLRLCGLSAPPRQFSPFASGIIH